MESLCAIQFIGLEVPIVGVTESGNSSAVFYMWERTSTFFTNHSPSQDYHH
jgi:hypothetical protein